MTTIIKNKVKEENLARVPAKYRLSKKTLEGMIEFVSKERRPW